MIRSAAQQKKIRDYYIQKHQVQKLCKQYRNRRNDGLAYQIWDNITHRIDSSLKHYGIKRRLTYQQLIQTSPGNLLEHIQHLFQEGMTDMNYGEWEVDHSIAIANFDLSLEEQQEKCFGYSNLQPLWLRDNRSKGAR